MNKFLENTERENKSELNANFVSAANLKREKPTRKKRWNWDGALQWPFLIDLKLCPEKLESVETYTYFRILFS